MKQAIKKFLSARKTTHGIAVNAMAATQGKPGFQTVDKPFVSKLSGLHA